MPKPIMIRPAPMASAPPGAPPGPAAQARRARARADRTLTVVTWLVLIALLAGFWWLAFGAFVDAALLATAS